MRIRLTSTAAALILAPAVLAALSGCATGPSKGMVTEGNPSLAGGWRMVETTKCKGTVQSVDAKERTLVIAPEEGSPVTCKFGPDVPTSEPFNPGDRVKAKVATESAIFAIKNGTPPSAGDGVWVSPKADTVNGGRILLKTSDTTATVQSVDPSYRLLKLNFDDGTKREIKVDYPANLLDVQPGDKVVIRTTQGMIVSIKNKSKAT